MSWFEEQIEQRRQKDEEVFSAALMQISDSVTGKKAKGYTTDAAGTGREAEKEILFFYGISERKVPEEIQGTEKRLEYLLRPHGILFRRVKLTRDWYKDAQGIMLGSKKSDGRSVALIPGSLLGYYYWDKETGKKIRVGKKNQDELTQEAILFYRPFPLKKLTLKDLLLYMLGNLSLSDAALTAVGAAAAAVPGLLLPVLNNQIFSRVIPQGELRLLLAMAVCLCCVSVSSTLLSAVSALLMAKIEIRINLSVESAAMQRVLSMPVAFFKEYNSGELSSRIQCLTLLCQTMVSSLLSTIMTAFFSLTCLWQIFLYTPTLVLPAVFTLGGTLLLALLTSRTEKKVGKQRMETSAKESGLSFALLSGVQKLKLAGAEKRAFARWGEAYARQTACLYHPPLLLKMNGVISLALLLVGNLALYYGAIHSGVSVAEYYAFHAAYGMAMGGIGSLTAAISGIAQIKPMLEMAEPLMNAVPEMAVKNQVLTRLSGGIEINNLSFRYKENMPPVIDGLSLKIRPGQYVAIVGASGCGKSTLFRLLLGFEQPQRGAIYYDGRDLNTLDTQSLRRHMGIVLQNSRLFSGDILSNILISAPWLDEKQAWEASELADIAEDIRRMPMGMHTRISEGSGGLSGGQKQRLLIARAVAPRPRILMLDEATSALDNLSQKQVSDALGSLKCTRIVIAHRLSTIQQCDRIILLKEGKIAEDGTYEELMEKGEEFSKLVERQKL